MFTLKGKKGLVVGIANSQSIAYGCAQSLTELGAEVAITYLNAKAKPYVAPLAEELGIKIVLPMDVEQPGEMETVFETLAQAWGSLDFIVHSIAYAPLTDLHGRVIDSSLEGFCRAMNISCHSFIRMAKLAEPLMQNGGSMVTMSYYGADEVIQNYGIMGAVKAALQAAARYMAAELGIKGIRVNVISPGPLLTRAASGIAKFDHLMKEAIERSPMHKLASIEEIGALASFLVCDLSKSITGDVIYVDGGFNITGD